MACFYKPFYEAHNNFVLAESVCCVHGYKAKMVSLSLAIKQNYSRIFLIRHLKGIRKK